MSAIIEALIGSPAYRAERRRRRAYARYCRERFGKRSRSYRRAMMSLRSL